MRKVLPRAGSASYGAVLQSLTVFPQLLFAREEPLLLLEPRGHSDTLGVRGRGICSWIKNKVLASLRGHQISLRGMSV